MTAEVTNDGGITVSIDRELPHWTVGYARRKLGVLLGHIRRPVESVRVRLTVVRNPAAAQRILGQVNVVLRGKQLCARVAADSPREAVDRLEAALSRRLEHTRRRGPRHRHAPAPAASGCDREPVVVRRKPVSPELMDCGQAVEVLEDMDYEFHLFVEAGTGQESVLYRAGSTGYQLAQRRPRPTAVRTGDAVVTVSPHPAPRLTLGEAGARLALSGLEFLYFVDTDTGGGSVLYRRHDGDLGLVSAR